MPLYRHHDKELLHIHVPKTGGTSITKAVEYHDGLVSFWRKAPLRQCGNVPPQHMTIEYTNKFFDLKKLNSFALIRHPWRRTASEFVWQGRRTNWTGMDNWLRSTLMDIDHEKYANHMLPQHKFVNDDVKLFRYDRDWGKVVDYIGKQLEIKNFDVTMSEQKIQVYTPPVTGVLSTSTLSMWEEFYKEDLELYHSL